MAKIINPNAGHRSRIREKYLKHGLDIFQDYEVLELLLIFSVPRKDMKPVAKELIKQFGSLQGALDASDEELLQIDGLGKTSVTFFRLIKEVIARYLINEGNRDLLSKSIDNLIQSSRLKMGNLRDEEFHMFSLNSQHELIKEDIISKGTINQAAVYPRKVIEIALKNNAAELIFCHNHPDGNLEPSEYDRTLTKALKLAAKTVSIDIYDHLIVTQQGYFSFRDNGII